MACIPTAVAYTVNLPTYVDCESKTVIPLFYNVDHVDHTWGTERPGGKQGLLRWKNGLRWSRLVVLKRISIVQDNYGIQPFSEVLN